MEDAQARRLLSPQWRKVHLGIDAETLEIRTIEITTMLLATRRHCQICWRRFQRASGSQSFVVMTPMTQKCHATIAERGADAVIPVRRNGQPWAKDAPGVGGRNETLRAMRRLGRKIWKKWSGYHRCSLVETKMHCFKLLGERVASRTFDRQITELEIRASVLNRFSQVGNPTTVRVA